ncbi:MAG: type II secretion system F family protein [Eubacterium sp.]|nr:type II secretion system F family protein [Eubacterium sp.]
MSESGGGRVNSRVDYNAYTYSLKEYVIYGAIGAAGGLGIMLLFYSHWIMAAIGILVGGAGFLKIHKKNLFEKRKWQLMVEFRDALASMIAALSAGYSMENAVGEALRDLTLLYGEERIILRELRDIRSRTELGVPLDELFYDLGVRSGVSDIIVFSQVYTTARRSGGNLVKVMKRTADAINEKTDIEREVRTMIAGKRLESLCMMVIPLMIIVYLRVFSPGFLNPLYHGMSGRLFMTVALVTYLAAVWWSRRIMNIRY